MLALSFDQRKLPRSMARSQWREIDRWRRMTQKRLAEEIERRTADLIAFGSTMPEAMRADILDQLVNPPLLMGPYQDLRDA